MTHRVSPHVELLRSFTARQRSRSVPTKRSSRRRLQAQRTKNTQTAAAAAMTTASSGYDRTQIEYPRQGWHDRDRQQSEQQDDRQPRRAAVAAGFVSPAQNRLGGSTNITKSSPHTVR